MKLEHHSNKTISRRIWDKVYQEWKGDVFKIDENIPRIFRSFEQRKVKRILDLGCGAGRHTIFFSKKGFEVYGIDVSSKGVRIVKQRLKKAGFSANIRVGSIYESLPYKDKFFDAVICIKTLNHARIEGIRKAIREIRRVLVQDGLVFVTVRKRVAKKKRLPHIDIAPRTYIPTGGKEKGMVHYLFNKKLLRQEFKDFRIYDIWVGDNDYYCLLAERK